MQFLNSLCNCLTGWREHKESRKMARRRRLDRLLLVCLCVLLLSNAFQLPSFHLNKPGTRYWAKKIVGKGEGVYELDGDFSEGNEEGEIPSDVMHYLQQNFGNGKSSKLTPLSAFGDDDDDDDENDSMETFRKKPDRERRKDRKDMKGTGSKESYKSRNMNNMRPTESDKVISSKSFHPQSRNPNERSHDRRREGERTEGRDSPKFSQNKKEYQDPRQSTTPKAAPIVNSLLRPEFFNKSWQQKDKRVFSQNKQETRQKTYDKSDEDDEDGDDDGYDDDEDDYEESDPFPRRKEKKKRDDRSNKNNNYNNYNNYQRQTMSGSSRMPNSAVRTTSRADSSPQQQQQQRARQKHNKQIPDFEQPIYLFDQNNPDNNPGSQKNNNQQQQQGSKTIPPPAEILNSQWKDKIKKGFKLLNSF